MASEDDTTHIPGWGIDADTRNDPTYPMRVRKDGQLAEAWPRPRQQGTRIEVLSSNERTEMPAAFGTAVPPAGLSGKLRRVAFRYSESNLLHWVVLLLADRVNMVEGVLDDVGHGHVPNIAKERGWPAEWQHERSRFVLRAVTVAVVAGVAISYLRSRRHRR